MGNGYSGGGTMLTMSTLLNSNGDGRGGSILAMGRVATATVMVGGVPHWQWAQAVMCMVWGRGHVGYGHA
jgi:hypothetical protein